MKMITKNILKFGSLITLVSLPIIATSSCGEKEKEKEYIENTDEESKDFFVPEKTFSIKDLREKLSDDLNAYRAKWNEWLWSTDEELEKEQVIQQAKIIIENAKGLLDDIGVQYFEETQEVLDSIYRQFENSNKRLAKNIHIKVVNKLNELEDSEALQHDIDTMSNNTFHLFGITDPTDIVAIDFGDFNGTVGVTSQANNIQSVVGNKVTKINTNSFKDAPITHLELNKAKYIGKNAFRNAQLKEIYLPEVTFIGSHAFSKSPVNTLTLRPKGNIKDNRKWFGMNLNGQSSFANIQDGAKVLIYKDAHKYASKSELHKGLSVAFHDSSSSKTNPVTKTIVLNGVSEKFVV